MCGIVGYLGGDLINFDLIRSPLENMMDQIASRGPDSSGKSFDSASRVAFGHRRLAIQDLSSAGHQPMSSVSDRYSITYNGEIYNNNVIREELSNAGFAPNWRGHSDTETLLFCFEAWGIKETIVKLSGMFAMAIWDNKCKKLILVRDRVGEKPLYFGWQGSGISRTFIFGSALKAIKKHPQFENEICRDSLALYMRYCYVPAPNSIYKNIRKLVPGTMLTVSLLDDECLIEKYWDTIETVKNGFKTPFEGSITQIADNLESELKQTISQQMISDVPLGAFLSGGVDSSTITALMQSVSSNPVKTFTIGFEEAGYNEAEFAKLVASHIGTEHTELYVSSQDAIDVIPKLPELYCEPFADSSQIPTFLVSSLARQHVTVSLSGDGGDELFCGYNRYTYTDKLWKWLRLTPSILRKNLGEGLGGISAHRWNQVFKLVDKLSPQKFNGVVLGNNLRKGARVISSHELTELYKGLVSTWQDPTALVIGASESENLLLKDVGLITDVSDIKKMMTFDMVSYLPDDILVKVDRAAMGVSLETRVPFLDHKIIEFASRIPLEMNLGSGKGKGVLREVLYRHVPKHLIERPKMGFGIPLGEWLRGPLKDWVEELLDESLLRSQGFFYPSPIRSMWSEHLSGGHDRAPQLWVVLMFQAWLAEND